MSQRTRTAWTSSSIRRRATRTIHARRASPRRARTTRSPSRSPTPPTPGPIATSASNALTIDQTGLFVGTLTSNQAVWYRFYYGNPGANATVNVGMAPTADSTDLNLYTGTDVSSLTQQTGSATRSGNTLSRTVNLPNPQFVYLTVVNNNSNQVVAYSGTVAPAAAPPLSATAVPTAGATVTTTP